MKRLISVIMFCMLIMVSFSTVKVSADTGPKPSVRITFENMGSETCYATLLSKTPSTGPARVWDGTESSIYYDGLSKEIWQAFVEYEDTDGYYFLQRGWLLYSSKNELAWTYYPPDNFKILLYYPETNTFITSGICEKYAFDSYFTVNMAGMEIESVKGQDALEVKESYDYTWEIISLICRIIITIIIEVVIALIFGFGHKKLLTVIIGTNAITQIVLNVLLNIVNYNRGNQAFLFVYIMLEAVVFVIEAILYSHIFNRLSRRKISKNKATIYAFVANILSFSGGYMIATLIPGIF